jgi:isoaspartyl peptidase/L-asparaginase-like protein (Ntn-hydrolase superfamily)
MIEQTRPELTNYGHALLDAVFHIVMPNHNPLMLATWSFGRRSIAAGWDALAAGGSALDAGEAACRFAETDLENPTVGVGGYPDRDGHVTLDAAVMLSPSQCGGVCGVRTAVHPITLARAVMERTPHKLIAGGGADQFAAEQDMETGPLLIESSQQKWRQWQASNKSSAPIANMEESHDTIGVLSLDTRGTLAACCSTSGISWKLPGRVGDSPLIGQGLYAEPKIGACVCTGHGELVMGVCGSFLAVETLRRGGSPTDAITEVLKRIAGSYTLATSDQVGVIVLAADGRFSTGSLRKGFQIAVRDRQRDEVISPEVVLLGD